MAALTLNCSAAGLHKAGWKIAKNEEACYITIDEDEEEVDIPKTDSNSTSQWSLLPDLLLEEIFSYLDYKERYYASLVCRHWYRGFYLPKVWSNFLVNDRTLTRTKFNYYSGWQYLLDHMRTQNCITRIGRHLRGLEFRPEHSFNNIYTFMTMLSWNIDRGRETHGPAELVGVGRRIRSLVYYFPCSMSQANDPEGIKLFGTGGQLLKGLKDLLFRLRDLRTLKLVDFVLERFEANHLLDEVLEACCTKMRVLNLVNVTTTHCPIMHVGLFLNLQILEISPQNIDDDVLCLLADTRLKHLLLLQNRYTPAAREITACSMRAWRVVKRDNPTLKVHIRVESMGACEIVFQPEAPVYSISYSSPKSKVEADVLLHIVDHYQNTLAVYGQEQLPRFVSPKPFHNRIDSLMLLLCRQCFNLHTLVIREKISTATVLLLAKNGKNLRRLIVRRFAVILRCDWPRHPRWSLEFYTWLRRTSRSYEAVEREVSNILGHPWRFLSDADFKRIEIDGKCEL